ncbi:MAG: acyl-CoA dehydrogenase family protein [Candidatus Binatus sp.]|uniref:acyl-CoA dehydrogenase family protein n=1 Tax=Candidatus Binatus sp. TaxID=2811406 RepID=UPI002717353F|nr:acyl-CoA dehydrogenase family protein [Candidatus Binatus sp.]MDO8434295.1 acyl-CoA dehydrogenase family protein [Candidatus Binatus sp.]
MTENEREDIVQRARTVAVEKLAPRADTHDREGSFPTENFADLHRAGLLGLPIPVRYGGLGGGIGGDHRSFYPVVHEIARGCGSTALIYGHHAYVAGLVAQLGTENQQQRYFEQVLKRGALFASIGSEPAGGNLAAMSTTARRVAGGYVLNGRKRFGSGMGYTTFHMIWAQLEGESNLEKGLLLAFIEPDNPHIKIIRDWSSMGMRATATDGMELTECFVPDDDVLEGPGAYFRLPIPGLFFHTEFAANFTGVASGALDFAVQYVREQTRPWMGSDLTRAIDDPYLQYRFGEMYSLREASLSLVNRSAAAIQRAQDSGTQNDLVEAAKASWSAKIFATEASGKITNMVFQVCGARSTRMKYNLDRFWRDARTFTLHDPVDGRRQALGAVVLGAHEYRASII